MIVAQLPRRVLEQFVFFRPARLDELCIWYRVDKGADGGPGVDIAVCV